MPFGSGCLDIQAGDKLRRRPNGSFRIELFNWIVGFWGDVG